MALDRSRRASTSASASAARPSASSVSAAVSIAPSGPSGWASAPISASASAGWSAASAARARSARRVRGRASAATSWLSPSQSARLVASASGMTISTTARARGLPVAYTTQMRFPDALLFDAYVFVDWSGRDAPSSPRPCADAIWIAEQDARDAAPRETYCTTRQGATAHVFTALARHVAAGRRVLVGFDFPYGYPAGLAAALDIPGAGPPWERTWSALARSIVDDPDNRSNRF